MIFWDIYVIFPCFVSIIFIEIPLENPSQHIICRDKLIQLGKELKELQEIYQRDSISNKEAEGMNLAYDFMKCNAKTY